MARPTDYTPEKAAEICVSIGEGRSLKGICVSEDMPAQSTVYLWLTRHPEFSEMYAHAREEQAETLADEIVGIADAAGPDDVNAARLRVDARKWVAAKLKPRKYGEKITNEHTGPDGGPVKLERIERVVIDPANQDAAGVPTAT